MNLHFFSGCMGDPFFDWWWWSFCWREVRDSYCWGSLWWRGRRQPPYLWYQPSLVSSNKRAADWHWVSRICFLKYVLLIFLGFQTLIRLQLGQMAKRLIVFCFKIATNLPNAWLKRTRNDINGRQPLKTSRPTPQKGNSLQSKWGFNFGHHLCFLPAGLV